MKFNESLRDALDPNGILAPGRLVSGRSDIVAEVGRLARRPEILLKVEECEL